MKKRKIRTSLLAMTVVLVILLSVALAVAGFSIYRQDMIARDAVDPALSLGFGEVPYGDKQVMHLEADISALKEDTGFEASVAFEEGIQKTIEHLRKQMKR